MADSRVTLPYVDINETEGPLTFAGFFTPEEEAPGSVLLRDAAGRCAEISFDDDAWRKDGLVDRLDAHTAFRCGMEFERNITRPHLISLVERLERAEARAK